MFYRRDGPTFSPHVFGYISKVDPVAFRRTFEVDESQVIPVRFFVEGEPCKLLALIPATVRLFGPVDKTQPTYLLGADRIGHDVLNRIIYGTRISMSIGLVGVPMRSFSVSSSSSAASRPIPCGWDWRRHCPSTGRSCAPTLGSR